MSNCISLTEIPTRANHSVETRHSKSNAGNLDPKSTKHKPQRTATSPVTIPDDGDSVPPEDEILYSSGDAPARRKLLASFKRAVPENPSLAPKRLKNDDPALASTVVDVPAIDATPEFIKNPPAPIADLAVCLLSVSRSGGLTLHGFVR